METFNIHLTGVGGQGIGLLSEVILRAADHAGHDVKGVDTHGLAQRGGIVVSQIRIGKTVFSPLIPAGTADLVIALERHEALRGLNGMLRDGGVLIYYNTVWQPLEVRLGQAGEAGLEVIAAECAKRSVTEYRVLDPSLVDARMQNMAILAVVAEKRLIPGLDEGHFEKAMEDLMGSAMLEKNRRVFRSSVTRASISACPV